jgi:hypothetical protein
MPRRAWGSAPRNSDSRVPPRAIEKAGGLVAFGLLLLFDASRRPGSAWDRARLRTNLRFPHHCCEGSSDNPLTSRASSSSAEGRAHWESAFSLEGNLHLRRSGPPLGSQAWRPVGPVHHPRGWGARIASSSSLAGALAGSSGWGYAPSGMSLMIRTSQSAPYRPIGRFSKEPQPRRVSDRLHQGPGSSGVDFPDRPEGWSSSASRAGSGVAS